MNILENIFKIAHVLRTDVKCDANGIVANVIASVNGSSITNAMQWNTVYEYYVMHERLCNAKVIYLTKVNKHQGQIEVS